MMPELYLAGRRSARSARPLAAGAHRGFRSGGRHRDRHGPTWSRAGVHRRVLAVGRSRSKSGVQRHVGRFVDRAPVSASAVVAGAGRLLRAATSAPTIRRSGRAAATSGRWSRCEGPAQRRPPIPTPTCSRPTSRLEKVLASPPPVGPRSAMDEDLPVLRTGGVRGHQSATPAAASTTQARRTAGRLDPGHRDGGREADHVRGARDPVKPGGRGRLARRTCGAKARDQPPPSIRWDRGGDLRAVLLV